MSRRPGSSGTLHREGESSASLLGMTEREVLRVAGTGSIHCRRETAVSPNMRLAGGEWTGCKGGKTNASPNRPPTASPSENEGELDLHTKPRRVVVTDLSEESAFGAGRNAFAVWPRPVTVKRLSSFRPGGQERPRLAEAAGLLGCFMLTPLRGCWREEDRPRLLKP